MTDLLLQTWTASLIELSKLDHRRGRSRRWQPGEPLRLLFAGYNGALNTGSDVRVEEMLRQVRRVLGADRVKITVLTQNDTYTRGYFGNAEQVELADIFPPFLYREVPRHHGVVACEGSMFKSRFADALTTMMIGSLGMAAARNMLSVGYGAEAGDMSAVLRRMIRRYCDTSLVITRNEESERILRRLRVSTEPGTDTAWTFVPRGRGYAEQVLRESGWDGKLPILAVCPINPFWWPVKASLAKALARRVTGAWSDSHYRSVYFHTSGKAVDEAYERYLSAIVDSVTGFAREHAVFPILVAMERLDRDACLRLSPRMRTRQGAAPIFTSDERDMYELVSILRASHMIVSSRFHAIVTSMPALVPSAGITMDERIRNLMHDRGHEDLLLEVDDPDLKEKLDDVLEQLWSDRDVFRAGIGESVVRNLKAMSRMGHFFEAEVARRFPEFPVRSGVVPWEDYLPPLDPELRALVEKYEAASEREPRRVPVA